jgi:hypothetical protein
MINIYNGANKEQKLIDISTSEKRLGFIKDGLTSFLGKRDKDEETSLYLICYTCVVDLKDPIKTFDTHTEMVLEKWVDLDIAIL